MTREALVQASYLVASVLFILGLRGLTHPDRARRGMQLAALGMLLAIVGTLLQHEIVRYDWILAGLVLGSVIGYPLGMWVPMTAMPQRIAISHMFGALAATLVGVAEYYTRHHGADVSSGQMAALAFEVMFGSLTITGSFMAFGKLQEILPSAPVTFRGQNLVSLALFGGMVALGAWLVVDPARPAAFYAMVGLGLCFGVSLVLPIGGADMPVVISLLNSYAGLASSATGFAIDNNVLIIAGALDGASGFILSVIMSRAMNRSFRNVLFGAFGAPQPAAAAGSVERTVRSITAEDAAIQLAWARKLIVVPGYGMAVAQCQHQVRELAELVEKNGGEVIFAIHPVAGRMPGHMNVLLAEANVPYDRLKDLDQVNGEFKNADVALVIGANDVVNPAARNDPSSPIHGMPILNVDEARSVIVMKRSMNPGFAGIDNALFYLPRTSMLFGDAKGSLEKLLAEVKQASSGR
ncbi:MAG TPA: NAD(P)(+) transhydrogenase (Re/Si-specific) subunit beta [Anaeromyxobacteraceae bacterium]|nr:NAD(P)(+) transhydrogenase (Re/Si-specific) subunit beta [Anaeromyxobacteraceae bacterium]